MKLLKVRLFTFVLFLSLALLICLADRAPVFLQSGLAAGSISARFESYLQGVLQHTIPAPYAQRILIPYLIRGVSLLAPSLTSITIDFILKSAILFLTQIVFWYYLRSFLNDLESLASVFLFDSYMAFILSHLQGPSAIETMDIFNVFIFCLGLLTLFRRQFLTLSVVLLIGMVNRETPAFLFIPFLVKAVRDKFPVWSLIAVLFCIAIPYLGLKLLIPASLPEWISFAKISSNVPFISSEHTREALVGNARLLLLMGPLVLLSLLHFKNKPLYLRVMFTIVPFFVVTHYLVGAIIEGRLWMPLLPILIPLAMSSLSAMIGKVVSSTPLENA